MKLIRKNMASRSSIESPRVCAFPRSTRLIFLFVTLSTLVDTVRSISELSEARKTVPRPETTILQFFAKSFAPEAGTVSSQCQKDSLLYRDALEKYKPWALQMYDASTKIPAGLITGSTKQLGNYDECLRVRSEHGFVGKACSAKVQFVTTGKTGEPDQDDHHTGTEDLLLNVALASGLKNWTSGQSVPYEWLWCVPSSCTSRDIVETIEIGLDALKQLPKLDFVVRVGNESCHTEESDRPDFDTADWLYISLLILFGSLVTISTMYDLMKQRDPEKPEPKDTKHAIFVSFSAHNNAKSLLNTKRGSGSIACLDGLRFLSICWIIYGHSHYLKIVGVDLDLLSVATMHERWDALLLLNGNIATDTFFLLSGLLLASSELLLKEKNVDRYRFNVWKLYVRRYLRLTPAYAMIIGFYATLFYKIGNGPHWNTWVGDNRNFCRNNWWTNLLYVNNYVDVPNMCISQSWYLSVDMQLVWISPLFLYPMLSNGKRNELVFLSVLTIGLIASISAPLFITYFNRLTGTMLYYKNQTDVKNVYLQVYTKTYTRASPYLLGVGLGYLLRRIKPGETSMPRIFVIVGWSLATVAGLAAVFGPRGMYFPDHDYNDIEAAFYAGFHRPVFALATSWIIVASVFNCAGPLGAFLSWSFWVPLSRLTYSAYLTHYIILLHNSGSVRSPEHLTTFRVVQAFFGTLVTTLVISIVLSLTFEIPFVRLTNVLSSRPGPEASKSSAFEASDSTLEIYRAFEDQLSTVSRTYEDLANRYDRVDVGDFQRSEWPPEETSSKETSSTEDFDSESDDRYCVGAESPTSQDFRNHDKREQSDNFEFVKNRSV